MGFLRHPVWSFNKDMNVSRTSTPPPPRGGHGEGERVTRKVQEEEELQATCRWVSKMRDFCMFGCFVWMDLEASNEGCYLLRAPDVRFLWLTSVSGAEPDMYFYTETHLNTVWHLSNEPKHISWHSTNNLVVLEAFWLFCSLFSVGLEQSSPRVTTELK